VPRGINPSDLVRGTESEWTAHTRFGRGRSAFAFHRNALSYLSPSDRSGLACEGADGGHTRDGPGAFVAIRAKGELHKRPSKRTACDTTLHPTLKVDRLRRARRAWLCHDRVPGTTRSVARLEVDRSFRASRVGSGRVVAARA
jgi:hypothetical protein